LRWAVVVLTVVTEIGLFLWVWDMGRHLPDASHEGHG